MVDAKQPDSKVKRRSISRKDWESVESFLKDELKKRRTSTFRTDHETIWREVDRQVAMKPMRRIVANKAVNDWHATFELGELSKASEIITADVRRMLFPHSRAWFDPHSELGEVEAKEQKAVDSALRALMSQQHLDFALKARVELSIKEALHHGSFVAEIEWESRLKVADGSKVENVAAPVWVPHSMWNCYPDPSPSIIGTDMFYSGSMMILRHAPIRQFQDMAQGDGWMNAKMVKPRRKGEDIELVTYYGDLFIERADGDIFLPNAKAILANDIIVYYKALETSFKPIIYSGYERQDVRDPYYTSPIVKLSPMQKLGSIMANKLIESIALQVEPPILYDGTDPNFIMTDGPIIAPGAKTATRGSAKWEKLDVGDPNAASAGLQMAVRQIQEGTGVNAVRAGATLSDRATATEVTKVSQAGEIRTVDFVDKLESSGLRPFLYMQHELNRNRLSGYSFYNSEALAPDFMRATKADLPESVHFDVVGSKGLLGEEQRTQRTSAVTAFASQNPLFAPLLNPAALLTEMYQDAGNKNPERFINVQDGQDPRLMQVQQQAQQALQNMQQQAQEAIQQLQQKIQELESRQQVEMAKLEASQQTEQAKMQVEQQKAQAEMQLKQQIAEAELQLKREIAAGEISLKERVELAKIGVQAGEELQSIPVMDRLMDAFAQATAQGNSSAMEGMHGFMQQQNEALIMGLSQIAQQLNKPKRLVRDAKGRPVGVEVTE